MDAKPVKTIFLPYAVARAMLHLAGKKDARRYLNSVYVEASARETRLTATTGAILGTWRHVLPPGDLENDTGADHVFRGIVARAAIEELPAPRASDRRVLLALTVDGAGQCRIDSGPPFALVDATYPDYRQIFRAISDTPVAAGQFNPELLMLFVKFAKAANLGYERPAIRHAGPESGALVGLGTRDFVGIIYPYRMGAPQFEPRAWVLDDMAPAPVAKVAPEVADAFAMRDLPNVRVAA